MGIERTKLRANDDGGILMSSVFVILLAAVAFAGVFTGLWKIDTLGLIAICLGAFIGAMFFPNVYALILALALVVLGLLLWFDVIGIALPSWVADDTPEPPVTTERPARIWGDAV